MQPLKIASIIIYILAILTQGVDLAEGALHIKVLKDTDDLNGTTTAIDTNRGYYSYVLAGSVISTFLLFYLLISRCCDKSCCSFIGNYVVFHVTLVLQFAVATVLAVFLRNNEDSFENTKNAKNASEAAGVTSGTQYQIYGNNVVTKLILCE